MPMPIPEIPILDSIILLFFLFFGLVMSRY